MRPAIQVTSPYVSAYVVSKFGVRAFSECLQECLRLEPGTSGIHVCTILPQSVDTPIFRHAGNWTGRKIRPVPPIIGSCRVVNAILKSIERPRCQRTVDGLGPLLEIGHAVAPRLYNRLVAPVMNAGALSRAEADDSPGNIFAPMPSLNSRRPLARPAQGRRRCRNRRRRRGRGRRACSPCGLGHEASSSIWRCVPVPATAMRPPR